jgi:hypothetical protein
MPKSPFGFNVEEHLRDLRNIKRKLQRMYRKENLEDPAKMPAYKVSREWNLLRRLAGTSFMTDSLQARWKLIAREYGSMIAKENALQY